MARVSEPATTWLRGGLVHGNVGDFRLQNARIDSVVAGLDAPFPGALIDLAGQRHREDTLRALTPMLRVAGADLAAPRHARLFIERTADVAAVRVLAPAAHGVPLRMETRYSLQPGEPRMLVETTLLNQGRRALRGLRLGDRIDWGLAAAFAPGEGRSPRATGTFAWVGASARRVAYAYAAARGPFRARLAGNRATTELWSGELRPGGSVRVTRAVTVAIDGGSLARAVAGALRWRSASEIARAALVVRDEQDQPLAGARILLRRQGRPAVEALTGADGRARLALPRGRYVARAVAAGRASANVPLIVAHEGPPGRPQVLRTGPPSQLVFDVRAAPREGAPPAEGPCWIRVLGHGDTPTPWLGPPWTRRSANALLSETGKGVLPLPPGRYSVTVFRGAEHAVHRTELTLPPYRGATLVARLRRVVPFLGYVAVDIRHGERAQHLEDRNLAHRAEGIIATSPTVEGPRTLAVLDDHDPGAAEQRLRRWLQRLHAGERVVATAASLPDTLAPTPLDVRARTYVGVRDPRSVAAGVIAASLRRGQAIVSNGPQIVLEVAGKRPGGLVRLVRGKRRAVPLEVSVHAPDWIPLDTLTLLVNGVPLGEPLAVGAAGEHGLRLRATMTLPVPRDSSVIAVVRGSAAPSARNSAPVPVLAVTNPVYVDADGDGRCALRPISATADRTPPKARRTGR